MKNKIYIHFPIFVFSLNLLIFGVLANNLVGVFLEDSPSLLGVSLYGGFLLMISLFIYRTDITKLYVVDSTKILVQKRSFPFLVENDIWFDMPVTVKMGHRSAGRSSLVNIHIEDGEKSIALTRLNVFSPSNASAIIEKIKSYQQPIKSIKTGTVSPK